MMRQLNVGLTSQETSVERCQCRTGLPHCQNFSNHSVP